MPRISELPPVVGLSQQAMLPVVQNSTTYKTPVDSLVPPPYIIELYKEYPIDGTTNVSYSSNTNISGWLTNIKLDSPYVRYITQGEALGIEFQQDGVYELSINWHIKVLDEFGSPNPVTNGDLQILTNLTNSSANIFIPTNTNTRVNSKPLSSWSIIFENNELSSLVTLTETYYLNTNGADGIYVIDLSLNSLADSLTLYYDIRGVVVIKRLGSNPSDYTAY